MRLQCRPSWNGSANSSALGVARVTGLLWILAAGGCEAPPRTVELWIEPPAVFRFGSADAPPLSLPADSEDQVDVLASALREAVAESDSPGRISVRAPYVGSRLTEPEYLLLMRAACEAGVREFDLALIDPHNPAAPRRSYDPAAAGPYLPLLCGIAPVKVLPNAGSPRREFLPEPPD